MVVLLAGCTAPPQDDLPVESLVVDFAPEPDEPTYEFTILARSAEETAQDVTFRIFVNGQIQRFLEWPEDDRTAEYEPVRRFEVPAGTVSYDMVIDGNMVRGASIDVSECPNGKADTFVRINDHWKARSDYGCHSPGYVPDE